MGFSNHLGKSRLSGFFRHLGNGISGGLASMGNAIAKFKILNGLIQWLTGSYYTDSNGDIVDGTILDQSKQQGGYPNIASGYGLDFDGVSDVVTSTMDLGTYIGGSNFSWRINLFFPTGVTGNEWLIDADAIGTGAFSMAAIDNSNGIQVRVGGIIKTMNSGKDYVGSNENHDLIFVLDGNSGKLYDNGVLVDTQDFTGYTPLTYNGIVRFGERAGADRFQGYIYSTSLFTTNLNATQAAELANNPTISRPTGITDADVALDLRMIEGAGTLVKDYSGNGNNGTISGATWLPNIPYGQQMAFAGHNVTQNLIQNSVFNQVSPWAGTAGGTVFVEPTDKPDGVSSNSLRVVSGSGNDRGARISFSSTPIIANSTYTLGFWAKSDPLSSTNELRVDISDDPPKIIFLTTSWAYYTIQLTTDSPVAQFMDMAYYGGALLGDTFYINSPQLNIGSSLLPYLSVNGNSMLSNQFVNLAGTTDDATTDIEGNTITDFVYDIDRYKLPTTSVQVFDGVDDGVTTTAAIPSSGQFILRARFVFGDGTDRYVIHAHRNEVTSTDSLGISITQNFSTANGNLGVGLYVDESIFRNYQFTGFSSGQIVDVVLAVDVDSDEPLWCIVNGVLKTTYSTTQYIRIVGGSNYGFYFGYDNDNIGRWFDKYIHSVQIDGLHKWTAANGWVDEIGSNNGTVNGSPTSEIVALTYANHATPKTGIGLSFDGVNDSLTVSDNDSIDLTSNMTCLVWIKGTDTTNKVIAEKGVNSALVLQPNGSSQFYYYNGSSQAIGGNITGDILNGSWNLLAFTYDGVNKNLYLNGVLRDTKTVSAVSANSSDLTIGLRLGGTLPFNGSIASYRLFSTDLSLTQIQQLYQNPQLSIPTGLTKADLALDLRLDDAATTTARDYSGNANDGTISGATWIYGLEYPVKQVGLSNFNLGLSNELIFGDNDDSLIDIDGNPIVDPRLESEINFPYIYHEGLETPHRDSMNPTDGVTISFWTEYGFIDNGNAFSNVIVAKNDVGSTFGIRTNSTDFQILTNASASVLTLSFASAKTGIHHHVVVLKNTGAVEWYIDSVLVRTGTVTPNYANTNNLRWGNDVQNTRRYTKPIGDPMYFNRALTADEALSIYNFQKAKYE